MKVFAIFSLFSLAFAQIINGRGYLMVEDTHTNTIWNVYVQSDGKIKLSDQNSGSKTAFLVLDAYVNYESKVLTILRDGHLGLSHEAHPDVRILKTAGIYELSKPFYLDFIINEDSTIEAIFSSADHRSPVIVTFSFE